MKLVKEFTDLGKANDYITGVNEAYEKEVAEKKAAEDKSVLLQESLTKENVNSSGLAEKVIVITMEKEEVVKQLSASKKETAQAVSELVELSTRLDLQEKHGKDAIVVIVGGTNYKLVGDTFLYGGSSKTAKQLSEDKTELERMVKIGSGALVELTES